MRFMSIFCLSLLFASSHACLAGQSSHPSKTRQRSGAILHHHAPAGLDKASSQKDIPEGSDIYVTNELQKGVRVAFVDSEGNEEDSIVISPKDGPKEIKAEVAHGQPFKVVFWDARFGESPRENVVQHCHGGKSFHSPEQSPMHIHISLDSKSKKPVCTLASDSKTPTKKSLSYDERADALDKEISGLHNKMKRLGSS